MSTPRLSSCVVLAREHEEEGLQLFWAKRCPELAFLGGFHAFLGGGLEEGDASTPFDAPPGVLAALLGCAARELFEEAGVLVTPQGIFTAHAPHPTLHAAREGVLSGEQDFCALLLAADLCVDAARFIPMARWITPDFIPIRFETEFFLVWLTAREAQLVQSERLHESLQTSELLDGEWLTPRRALERHETGRAILSAPTIAILRHLHAHGQSSDFGQLPRCDQAQLQDPLSLLEYTGGTYMLPLRSPTIAPATHTNCAVIGERRFVVVDPGAHEPEEQAKLHRLVDTLLARGARFEAIVLTHHHIDHISGVPALLERYGEVPLWAHPKTGALLDELPALARSLRDGDVIELDEGEHELEVVFTPGHAPGHIALLHRRSHTLFCGDLVASVGTILVRPPEGHMGDYLASLRRVRELKLRALHPAHGWTIVDPEAHLSAYEAHRLAREERVYEALAKQEGWAEPMELVPLAYEDVHQDYWFLAAMSLTAHLIHLHEQGRAERDGESLRFKRAGDPRPSGA